MCRHAQTCTKLALYLKSHKSIFFCTRLKIFSKCDYSCLSCLRWTWTWGHLLVTGIALYFPSMRIWCGIVEFIYLLDCVLDIARANCSGSVRSSFSNPFGFRPLNFVLPLANIPIYQPSISSIKRCRLFALRSALASLVSFPCFQCAFCRRLMPSGVRGPVDSPPWVSQTFLSRMAGLPHCCFFLDDLAWQRLHLILLPAVIKYCSGLYIAQHRI